MSRFGRKSQWFSGMTLALIALAVLARLGLPYVVQLYINRTLVNMGSYTGHVDDVDIQLWRGAYSLKTLVIRKRDAPVSKPMFECPHVEIAISWDALINKTIAAKIKANQPKINFAAGGGGKAAQTGIGQDWKDVINHLVPIRIERLEVINGEVRYLDENYIPPIELHFTRFNAALTNLTNIRGKDGERVAEFDATATAMDNAPFEMHLKLDPFDRKPNFDLRMKLLGLDVQTLRSAMRAYLPFDADSGTLDIVIEAQGKNDHFSGNVKPIFQHLQLLSWKRDVGDHQDNPVKLATKAVASVLNLALQNQPKDQLAADVPVEGRLDAPSIQILATIGSLLQNAFVKALDPTYEHSPKPATSGNEKK